MIKRLKFAAATMVLGGFLLAGPGQTPGTAAQDGAALVKGRCVRCHDAGRIDKAQKDRKGWEQSVDRMIGKGAKLNAQEREAVLAYLSGR